MARRFEAGWRRDVVVVVAVLLAGVAVLVLLSLLADRFGWSSTLGAAVFVIAPVAFVSLFLLLRKHRSDILDRASKLAGLMALIGAATYFAFQLASGQLASDLVVIVEAKRVSDQQHDLLALVATLKHQRHSSLRLLDAVAFVRPHGSAPVKITLLDRYYRRKVSNAMLSDDRDASSGRPLRPVLNAGDEIQLAAYTRVPTGEPVIIDVVVLGEPHLGIVTEQWVSTVVSLPRHSGNSQEATDPANE